MATVSAIPSLATAQQAGLLNAVLTKAGVNQAGLRQAGYQGAQGAQARLSTASGITGTAQNAQGAQATAQQSAEALADAQTRALQQGELTSNNLNRIMGEDSPLLQRARARALDIANGRGLLNSSIASQSGTTAMIDTATPIAQADANAQINVLDKNLANQQQTNIFNAGQRQNNNQFNVGQVNDISKTNASLLQNNNQFNSGQQNNMTQFNVGQTNDMSKFNTGQANDVSKYNANLSQDANQFNANAFNQNQQFNTNSFNENQQFNTNALNRNQEFNAGEANRNSQFNASAFNNNQEFNVGQANQISAVNASEQNKILNTMLDNENKRELMEIQSKYETTINTQNFAGTLYQRTMQNIVDIVSNPDIQGKQNLINDQYKMLTNGLDLAQGLSGLELDLDFGSNLGTQNGIQISNDLLTNVNTLRSTAGITDANDRKVLLEAPPEFINGLLTTMNQGHLTNAENIATTWNNARKASGLPALSDGAISKILGAV